MTAVNQQKDNSKRVVFIGGLDDGYMAVEWLVEQPFLDLVGVFVIDEAVASTVSGFRSFDDIVGEPVLHKVIKIKEHIPEIKSLQPDLIIVIGFSQIIPRDILEIPRLGVIGFHSAVLPGRRGCSPIIWAMVDGLKETGVTMFFMDEGIDTGDVIAVKSFPIEPDDYSAQVLNKANQATLDLLKENLQAVLEGRSQRIKQDEALSTYTRKRGPADGEIDWNKPAQEIVNLIRALAPPYPMAHTFGGDGVPILIERAIAVPELKLPPSKYREQYDPFRQKVLCVVAHPDDEVLGVAGTLALHAQAGGEVQVIILSEGESEKLPTTQECSTRRACAYKAAQVLGINKIELYDFPDQRLDTVPFIEIIKVIENALEKYKPSVVYTHHGGDANTDHQVTFKAVYAACRPMTLIGSCVERLLTFETPSSTDQAPQIGDFVFNPNVFVNIEPVWNKKVQALQCYPTEIVGGKHPRSIEYIEALARVRGGHAGYYMAEGFVSIRERISNC
ncbi:MAG: PIG-L family deacetylase [Candidatus Saccharibacteria bacterium]